MPVTDLPEELLLTIIDYICEEGDFGGESGSAFASVNRCLSSSLLRKARRISIRTNNEKWKSDEKRAKLLGMIYDPYHQLLLGSQSDQHGFLSTSTISSMLSAVGGVYWFHEFGCISGSTLATLLSSMQRKVKILHLYNIPDLENFEVIPSTQSLHLHNGYKLKIDKLNLSAYPLLRSLRLYDCTSIREVSCLDGIHDLLINCCKNITDISSLNNNYRVRISYCEGINTYSKSFRSTHSLLIEERRRGIIVNPENCLQLKSLSVTNRMGITNFNISSLRVLSVTGATNLIVLPPNRLQMVSIINCRNFNSLDNMNHIQSIHLQDLNNITALTGLGPKNQIVTLKHMKNLEDISSLTESSVVNIRFCPLIQVFSTIVNCLKSVKELQVGQQSELPMFSFLASLRQLDVLRSLRVLELFRSRIDCLTQESCAVLKYLLLESLKNIEKFVLHGNFGNILMNEEIREEFMVISKEIKTILLRRRVVSAT